MAKDDQTKKSGLHKEISSIFDGVPIPTGKASPRPDAGTQKGAAGYDSPRPPAHPPQNPQIPGSNQRLGRPGPAEPGTQGSLQQVGKKLFAAKPGVNPARQKLMLLLVPILLVVLVVMLGRVVDIPFLSQKNPVTQKPIAQPPVVAVSTEINWKKPAPYPPGLRDPMRLTAGMVAQIQAKADAEAQAKADADAARQAQNANQQTTKVGEMTVKGILFSSDNPSAVIGTRIAHVGDIIADAKVVRINPDSVEFERDGETWTQTVEP